MRKLLLVALVGLTACSGLRESRINPFNWFGKSREEQVASAPVATRIDNRPLIDQVVSLKVDRRIGGAIVRAEGLAATQGWWDAELVAQNDGRPVNGTLAFEFRARPPVNPAPVGPERTRLVLVGYDLTSQDLAGVRRVVVIARNNRRTSSR